VSAAARPTGDDGSVLVLVVGLFAVLLLLVGVVVDVSAVVLAERSLASATDGAAVSAAQAIDLDAFYAGGPADGVPLSVTGVRDRVGAYADLAAQAQPGLTMTAEVDSGHTAVVRATRAYTVPFAGWLQVRPVELTAVARARAPLVAGP